MLEHQNVATIRSIYEAFGRGDIPTSSIDSTPTSSGTPP